MRQFASWSLRTGLVVACVGWLAGCAGPAVVDVYPNQERMIGKSPAAIVACAGTPIKQQVRNDVTLLQYYREAPILEESRPIGKSSFPTIRHGCWATVVVKEDRVAEVQYRFVPPTFDASNDCEEIFEPCLP
jgi:hypothetical protein